MTENKADPLRYALQRIAWLDPSAPIGEPPDPQYLIRQAQGIARDALASAPQPAAAPLVRDLCGDDLNGGFIRDLCFTVWKICHEPKHSDGNSDWGSDTLPVVQEAVGCDACGDGGGAGAMSEQKELGRRTKAELEALFGNMYSGWERGVVITQERFGTGETLFSERPMTPLELAARYVAAEIGANIYEIAGRAAFAPIITFSQIQVHIGPVFETLVSERDALVKALQSALDRWNAYADIGEEGAADSRLIRTDEGDLYHECRRVLAAAGETQNG